jgi:DNA recombination protein RmuC
MDIFIIIALAVTVILLIAAVIILIDIRKKGGRPTEDKSSEKLIEISAALNEMKGTVSDRLADMGRATADRLADFNERMREQNYGIDNMNRRIAELNTETHDRLKEIKGVVDEKLTENLKKQVDSSFAQVSEQLAAVFKGLGEMQSLASGVGDLKKMLSNVKTRGTWGEVSLSILLEQVLTSGQFAANTCISGTERVDFTINLPGKEDGDVWLPIDAKFPLEDYQRLVDAADIGNQEGVAEAARNLDRRIEDEAKKIRDKYINPPRTTDFAILYLPIEGLFAEVLRRPGLAEKIQSKYRVVLAGPTTLTALLNSLQMGFKSVAIEKRTSEIWKLLAAFRNDFRKFSDLLDKTQKKLSDAADGIEDAKKRSGLIQKQLRKIDAYEDKEELTGAEYFAFELESTENDDS